MTYSSRTIRLPINPVDIGLRLCGFRTGERLIGIGSRERWQRNVYGSKSRVIRHQGHRDRGHAERLLVPGTRKDYVFHPRSAEGLGGLFSEHPTDGVAQIRFAAPVRANNSSDSTAVEFHFSPVVKRFEALDFDSLQLQQKIRPFLRHFLGGDSIVTGITQRVKHSGLAIWRMLRQEPQYIGVQFS